MQTIRNPFLIAKVVTRICCGMPWHLWGQTFTTLYSFSDGIDGALPHGTLVSGNTFYGTTYQEASSNGAVELGTVFAIGISGTGFSNVHVFSNLDGYGPMAGVISSGNTLYGTAASGGSWGNGTVFAVNTDGSGFRTLHSFDALSLGLEGAHTNSDGTTPQASLILSGNTLYGTASFGGPGEGGTVFAVNTDGSGFTNLHSFALPDDGYRPSSGLVLSSNTLYGTTEYGGAGGLRNGTVFAVSTDGAGFLILHSFAGSEGAYPGSLVLSGKTLYGATGGDTSGNGTVFAMNTDGSGFRVLHSFTATAISYPYTNSDGARPSWLVLSGNTLYGTTVIGGRAGNGTVFSLKTDGSGFASLYSFTAISYGTNRDGRWPSGLTLSGNTLYGTTSNGGLSANGTVFSLSIPPELGITKAGMAVVLFWPTNFGGFTLQSTTNLASAIWTAQMPAPVVINSQNVVTNPIDGTQQFFRLSQ